MTMGKILLAAATDNAMPLAKAIPIGIASGLVAAGIIFAAIFLLSRLLGWWR